MMPTHSAFAARIYSHTLREASAKAVALYRVTLKELPILTKNYDLEFPLAQMRRIVRQDFEKYKDVSDPTIVDQLVFRGISELEEARLQWKTKSHVMRYFSPSLNKAAALDALLQRHGSATLPKAKTL